MRLIMRDASSRHWEASHENFYVRSLMKRLRLLWTLAKAARDFQKQNLLARYQKTNNYGFSIKGLTL